MPWGGLRILKLCGLSHASPAHALPAHALLTELLLPFADGTCCAQGGYKLPGHG